MPKYKIRTQVLHKGSPPICLKSHRQCRGCFGWRNMLKAIQTNDTWQNYPIRCIATGMALKVEKVRV